MAVLNEQQELGREMGSISRKNQDENIRNTTADIIDFDSNMSIGDDTNDRESASWIMVLIYSSGICSGRTV